MKQQKTLVVIGNQATLVVCDSVQLEIMAVSKDKKTVIVTDPKTGKFYTNNKEKALAFVKEDVENMELPALFLQATIDIAGLEEVNALPVEL